MMCFSTTLLRRLPHSRGKNSCPSQLLPIRHRAVYGSLYGQTYAQSGEKRRVKSVHRPVQSCSHHQHTETHRGNDPVDLSVWKSNQWNGWWNFQVAGTWKICARLIHIYRNAPSVIFICTVMFSGNWTERKMDERHHLWSFISMYKIGLYIECI